MFAFGRINRLKTEAAARTISFGGSTARRVEFDGCIVHGYADEQMTPEAALRVGAAFASRFALPAKAAVCASGEPISVVLKYAHLRALRHRALMPRP